MHHLLAWGLSLHAARRHYPDTVLITDLAGKRLLVDRLGLQFADVSTELERLRDADPAWWALGKLLAYSMQDRPYVHIDTDVFLWKPLPATLVAAPVFTQSPEYTHPAGSAHAEIEDAFAASAAPLPVEWEWARSRSTSTFKEENCGIVGGTNVAFLRYYANTAIDLIQHPGNGEAWSRLPYRYAYNTIVEQFFLSACIDFYRFHPDAPLGDVRVKHLFATPNDAYNANHAARAGFTHLLGDAKGNPAVGRRLEERMRREDPAFYGRCREYC
jgi:hypothetical protein